MDVKLSSEQVQLQDSVAKMLSAEYRFQTREKIVDSETGWSASVWRQFADQGLLGLMVPEEYGGIGGSAADLMSVMMELGRALVVEPYLTSAVLASSALRHSDNAAARDRHLPALASGEYHLCFAHDETRRAADTVTARQVGDQWFLTGRKVAVMHARDARGIVVSATGGPSGSDQGRGLFLVEASAAHMAMRSYRLFDQTRAADIDFTGVQAEVLTAPGASGELSLSKTLHVGTAAICAEAVGLLRATLQMTIDYLGVRKQFGQPLSANQALRHRVAEMASAIEMCEAMAALATIAVDDPASVDPLKDMARAKLLVGRHGRWVCEQAVQLHGGIGVTDEYPVGHCLQRMLVLDALLGDQDKLLDFLAA